MPPRTRTLFLAIAIASGLSASTYTVSEVGVAPSTFYVYAAHGINAAGEVVGEWKFAHGTASSAQAFWYLGGVSTPLGIAVAATGVNTAGGIVGSLAIGPEGYLWSDGFFTHLGFLSGYASSVATGISDGGQIVGYSATSAGLAQAFLYSGGAMSALGFLPGGTQSWATGVNNAGQAVGYSTTASGHLQAFLYSAGVMTGLGTLPGYTDSVATAINASGQVVGYATDSAGNTQAFLYAGGSMVGLGSLPGYSSAATAINSNGQIVGWLSQPNPAPAGPQALAGAFLYTGGQMHDLNALADPGQDLGAARVFVEATGINDSGLIIANSAHSAYLLSPPQGKFVPVTPCRIADTRNTPGPFGGPSLDGVSARSFAVPQSACGIPATAVAYSLNVTAVPQGPLGYLTLWPAGANQPLVSTLNSPQGEIVANAAIVPAGQGGAVSVFGANPTDVILDIDGYFDPSAGDSFYSVPPCRVADTRNATGPLGGPSLTTGQTRDFPVLSSSCHLPPAATAYSMNVTAVPAGYLAYLTTWATGQPQPFVSTLNSPTGKIVANAAIVPAGTNGATSVYVTNPSAVVLDTNGYFAPSGSPGALTFHSIAPCRVVDTRNADGPFGGPVMGAASTRSFAIPASPCSIPSTAVAYSLNVTVVPEGPLAYLTAWPTGSAQPLVSTLNAPDGAVLANAAIVPAGTNGAISIFVTDPTHVILDINGYFAP